MSIAINHRIRGVSALFLTVLSLACSGGPATRMSGPPPVPVTVATVQTSTVPILIQTIGTVEPIETVAVHARVEGELIQVGFTPGDAVKSGDLLFVLDPRPFKATLEQAQAQLQRDQAMQDKAQQDLTRYTGLAAKEYATVEQLQDAQAQAKAARAAVAADQAAVDNAQLQFQYCYVRSPIAGRTGALLVKMGNIVHVNDPQPLVVVNQTQPIDVRFAVPEQNLATIRAKTAATAKFSVTATLRQAQAEPLEGQVNFVDNAVDPTTGTLLVKARFANKDERLWPGQFVDVNINLGDEIDVLTVPTPAIQTGQQGPFVFVVAQDQSVEMRNVTVRRTVGEVSVIDKGLSAGEQVVTDGQLRLTPGAHVLIKAGAAQRPQP